MRQQARFSTAHASDGVARRYMAWIGHFEFGLNFRPINFSGWLDGRAIDSEPTADFWTLRAPTTIERAAADGGETLQEARAVHAELRAAAIATLPSPAIA